MNIGELKKMSKEIYKDQWNNIIIFIIAAVVIYIVGNYIDRIVFKNISIASTLAEIVIEFGVVSFFITLVREGTSDWKRIMDIFDYNFLKVIGLAIVRDIIIVLWSFLLIIPGIIKAYSYAMALYVYRDNPNIGIMEALRKSERIMKGHRWKLFKLHISYWLWYILALFTFGIALIYIFPWINTAQVLFYEEIKGNIIQEAEVSQ